MQLRSRLITTVCAFSLTLFSHIAQSQLLDLVVAHEFNKERSLYLSKKYVIEEVFGKSMETILFDIDPLASTSSLEVASLAYSCQMKGKQGILFTFWGNFWNEQGISYTGYGFKNIDRDSAIILLDRIRKEIDYITQYNSALPENDANTYFTFSDLTFLLKPEKFGASIRIFWKKFTIDSIKFTKFNQN